MIHFLKICLHEICSIAETFQVFVESTLLFYFHFILEVKNYFIAELEM